MIIGFLSGILILKSCKDKNPDNAAPEIENPTKIEVKDQKDAIKKKTIVFFGNSLTAGYGLDEHESFPSLIQERLDSLEYAYTVVNAGLSGETSAGGKGRISWVLREPVDVFVLELGANDMLRGLDLTSTNENLRGILDVVREKSPEAEIIVVGMEAPPNMGADYVTRFRSIFNELAKDYNAGLIPFLLDGVAGIPDLNLADQKHPNAAGQRIVMENVWEVLIKHL